MSRINEETVGMFDTVERVTAWGNNLIDAIDCILESSSPKDCENFWDESEEITGFKIISARLIGHLKNKGNINEVWEFEIMKITDWSEEE